MPLLPPCVHCPLSLSYPCSSLLVSLPVSPVLLKVHVFSTNGFMLKLTSIQDITLYQHLKSHFTNFYNVGSFANLAPWMQGCQQLLVCCKSMFMSQFGTYIFIDCAIQSKVGFRRAPRLIHFQS